jgi:pimeloyl-ACP methyl ester carboxylesterase
MEIAYETFGDPHGRPLILIMGLITPMIGWPEPFCRMLADAGHRVIRFDNRDVGFSSKLEHLGTPDPAKIMELLRAGKLPRVPYTLSDMAADTFGLMDALDMGSAHICGLSMGGMIAQVMAMENPGRMESLICMETTTGEIDLPPATPEALAAMMSSPPAQREAYLNHIVEVYRAFSGGSNRYDADLQRRMSADIYDRMWYPNGFFRQMTAIMAAPGRRKALAAVRTPTLVIHGACDTLLPVAHGKDIAAAIPGAGLRVVEGLGHGMAYPSLWQEMATAISDHTR